MGAQRWVPLRSLVIWGSIMQRLVTYGSLCALLLAASEARPCGGAFGASVSIDPVQQIVVSYRNGIETYVFNPYFCGQSNSFGLILPVPAMLTQNPALEQAQLYKDLATVTAPTYVDKTQCYSAAGGSPSRGTGGAGSLSNDGTTVIQRGQVGIFDWALLQATSSTAFTDWLTANGFPYQASAQTAFSSYVSNGWYFVAFKVSTAGGSGVGGAGSTTPTSTSSTKICGNFGPIALAFPSATQPVVPARIAAVSSNQLTWTLFTLASQQLKLRDYPSTLRFSGPVGDSEMSTYPSLAAVAQSGDRLTELQMSFSSLNVNDILLVPDPAQADYRREETRIVYVSCTGGAPTTGASSAIHAGGTSGAGGVSTGGISTGPSSAGGVSTGGVSTGGVPTSVYAPTGGSNAQAGSSGSALETATGGVLASTSAAPTTTREESGCSIAAPGSRDKSAFSAIILTLSALCVRRRRWR